MSHPPFFSSVLDAGTVHTGIVDGVALGQTVEKGAVLVTFRSLT